MVATVLAPAHAITLGDITMRSALGEQLNATVPVQIAQGEYLGAACVSAPDPTGTELGALRGVRIQVPETAAAGTHEIRLTTLRRLYEPMYELQLQVRCPGTPLVLRQYVLMLDLPGTLSEPAPLAVAAPAVAMPVAAAPDVAAEPQPVPATRADRPARSAPAGAPIGAGGRYRVSNGDTLFGIAQRVRDRGGLGIWAFADRIMAANPSAFVAGNPDLIKLGSDIEIPGTTAAPPVAAAAAAPSATPEANAIGTAADAIAAAPAPAVPAAAATPDALPAPDSIAAQPEPPAAVVAPRAKSKPAARRPAEDSGKSWWLATLAVAAGIALGVLALRRRLTDAIRELLARRAARGTPVIVAPGSPASAAPFAAMPGRARISESAMVVEEQPPEVSTQELRDIEPTTRTAMLTRAAADEPKSGGLEFEAELDSLFTDEHGLSLPALDGAAGTMAELDLDLTHAVPDAVPARNVPKRPDDNSQGASRRASDAFATPLDDTAEHLDLQSLAVSAEGDENLSQTLMEALTLLERDYEDELTASQIVDLSKLSGQDAGDDAEDLLARTGTGSHRRR